MPGAVLAACALLAGAHADGVTVRSATPVADAGWSPAAGGSYAADPVHTRLCRVEGTIEGNIGFELWLPEDWNGRMLGAGVGGDAGVFNYTDMSRRVGEGFAVVSTDSG